eukprot:CAMPEP_0170542734 /NCGR_PEP_ID=MMETSP0211-20121228/2076_1 /TAXON_ID=311385 /ORGANISM="Pseudokeronopsis sp., Strain OXSARD2" /LENGTH=89 /DNA_ID=CAMNT_0010845901 /DNA_START=304 /DNA_END=569 /DNA_ORIENTATION=-
MDMKEMQDLIKQFSKETIKISSNQEAIDMAMEVNIEDFDTDADELYNVVLGGIGLDYQSMEQNSIKGKIQEQQEASLEKSNKDTEELEA